MKTKLLYWSICLFLGLSLQSCVDSKKFEFSKMSDKIEGTGSLAAKVAYSKIKVSDLLKTSSTSYLMYDKTQDSLLRIVYNNDSLYSVGVDQVYKTPTVSPVNKTVTLNPVQIGTIGKTTTITLQDLSIHMQPGPTKTAIDAARNLAAAGGQAPVPSMTAVAAGDYSSPVFPDFEYVVFSGGSLRIDLTNKLAIPISLTLNVCNSTNLNSPLEVFQVNLSAGSSTSIVRPLSGKTYTNSLVGRIVSFSSAGSSGVPVSMKSTDYISYTMSFVNPVVSSGKAKLPSQSTSSIIDFKDQSSPVQLKEVKLTKGTVNLRFVSKFSSTIQFDITMPFTKKNGLPLTKTITVDPNTTLNTTIDLSGAVSFLDLGNSSTYNSIQIDYTASCNSGGMALFKVGDQFTCDLTVSNVDFDYVKGYFGKQNIVIDPKDVKLGIDAFNNLDNITLRDPRLTLVVSNYSMGVPMQFTPNVVGYYKDNTKSPVTLTYNSGLPLAVTPAGGLYQYSTPNNYLYDSVTTDKTIVSLMSLPPSSIKFSGKAEVNPAGYNATNFITRKAYLKVGAKLDVPFEINTNGITFRDTLENTISSDLNSVKEAKLIVDYINGLPLNAGIALLLLDAADRYFGKIDVKNSDGSPVVLTQAPYDAATGKTTPVSGKFIVDLTTANIQDLVKAKKIVIFGVVSTGGKTVRFKGYQALDVKLKTTATLDYSKI